MLVLGICASLSQKIQIAVDKKHCSILIVCSKSASQWLIISGLCSELSKQLSTRTLIEKFSHRLLDRTASFCFILAAENASINYFFCNRLLSLRQRYPCLVWQIWLWSWHLLHFTGQFCCIGQDEVAERKTFLMHRCSYLHLWLSKNIGLWLICARLLPFSQVQIIC